MPQDIDTLLREALRADMLKYMAYDLALLEFEVPPPRRPPLSPSWARLTHGSQSGDPGLCWLPLGD